MIILYFAITELLIQFLTREIIFKKIVTMLDNIFGIIIYIFLFRPRHEFVFFHELLECRKCTGFWVSLIISLLMNVVFIDSFIYPINNIITAIFTTYLLYYASEGIITHHQTVIIKD